MKQSEYGKEGYKGEKKHKLFDDLRLFLSFQKRNAFFQTLSVLSSYLHN